jgi:hypothetical protein
MEIALRGRTRCAEQRTPLSAMRRPLTADFVEKVFGERGILMVTR